jgi:hypothetical protein
VLLAFGKSFGVSVFSTVTIKAPVWSIALIAIVCMLLFKVLGDIFRWSPVFIFIREIFASAGAPGITFVVRPPIRPADASFKCKVFVDITNQLPRQPVHLCYGIFCLQQE